MPKGKPTLPDALVRLAGLLGEALGGPPAPVTAMDASLVALALRRHQVGSLLHAVVFHGRRPIVSDLLEELAQRYRVNAMQVAEATARLQRIAAAFETQGITWMAFKGVAQAAQLYADPAWRESADIDILVPPREFARALETLSGLGYIASNPPMPPIRALRKPMLSAVRDVSMVARDNLSCSLELHRRLFFAGGLRAESLRLAAGSGPVPSPVVGSDLALYLIAHGALSFWVRLKWLVDLVPLFARLKDAERAVLPERARRAGVENSVAASLLLLRALFPFVTLDPLTPWLDRKQDEPAAQICLQRYMQMLSLDSDWRHSPLDNAVMAWRSCWLLFEAPSTRARMLVSAPISSMTRRIAGTLNKADRALSWSDTSP